jgi:hypothetical protein
MTHIFSPPHCWPYTVCLALIMPKGALSDHVKSLARSKLKDAKIWEAVDVKNMKRQWRCGKLSV